MIPFHKVRSESEHGAALANGIGSSCSRLRSESSRLVVAGNRTAACWQDWMLGPTPGITNDHKKGVRAAGKAVTWLELEYWQDS